MLKAPLSSSQEMFCKQGEERDVVPEYPKTLVSGFVVSLSRKPIKLFAEQHSDRYYARDSVTISVDGISAEVKRKDLYRDGGTRIIRTNLGTLVLPHRLNDPDHRPRWNGQIVIEDGTV